MARALEYTAPINLDHPELVKLLELAEALHAAVPLTKVESTYNAGTGALENAITALDGDVWQTEIVFELPIPSQNPGMRFTVPDLWKRDTEIPRIRVLDDQMVQLVNVYGLTQLEITWS